MQRRFCLLLLLYGHTSQFTVAACYSTMTTTLVVNQSSRVSRVFFLCVKSYRASRHDTKFVCPIIQFPYCTFLRICLLKIDFRVLCFQLSFFFLKNKVITMVNHHIYTCSRSNQNKLDKCLLDWSLRKDMLRGYIVLEKYNTWHRFDLHKYSLKIIFVQSRFFFDFSSMYKKYFFPMIIHTIHRTNISMRITQYWKRS